MKLAALSADQLQKLQALEQTVEATVLAYEPIGAVADLAEEQVQSLQTMEEETGLVLLAVSTD